MDCIFCKIASKEISAKILVETKSCIGFLDAFPLAKGHSLIIPKTIESCNLKEGMIVTIKYGHGLPWATIVSPDD